MTGAGCMLSVFIREPEFQGQTKDRLATAAAQKIVEHAIKDPFDHWLSGNPMQANKLLEFVIERAEERLRRRQEKDIARKSRGAQAAPARQARRLHQFGRRRLGNFHRRGQFSRRLGQAGARPRAARRSCRCAAKSSTSPPPARTSSRRMPQLADLIQALGCGTGAHFPERTCATSRSSS